MQNPTIASGKINERKCMIYSWERSGVRNNGVEDVAFTMQVRIVRFKDNGEFWQYSKYSDQTSWGTPLRGAKRQTQMEALANKVEMTIKHG